jgi:7-methyl-GTP pyrophosphatase
MSQLILASTSPYRRELLARLGLAFSVAAPGVNEQPLPGEPPRNTARRLAVAKAQNVAARPGALVIGADQVATLDDQPLGKPGGHDAALEQLRRCQGKTVVFYTAVAVVGREAAPHWATVDETRVRFATLPEPALDRYLRREQPYDCAGSFKAEGLGIALFERIESTDPTALLGLPLIWLAATLRQAGLDPLA